MILRLRDTWYVSLAIRSHSVTCHPAQVDTPHLNPSQRQVLDLPTPDGWKAELTYVTVQQESP